MNDRYNVAVLFSRQAHHSILQDSSRAFVVLLSAQVSYSVYYNEVRRVMAYKLFSELKAFVRVVLSQAVVCKVRLFLVRVEATH